MYMPILSGLSYVPWFKIGWTPRCGRSGCSLSLASSSQIHIRNDRLQKNGSVGASKLRSRQRMTGEQGTDNKRIIRHLVAHRKHIHVIFLSRSIVVNPAVKQLQAQLPSFECPLRRDQRGGLVCKSQAQNAETPKEE